MFIGLSRVIDLLSDPSIDLKSGSINSDYKFLFELLLPDNPAILQTAPGIPP